ncbi:MAG: glycosyltransferase [Syntrophotaleaceae bacterium]
MKDATVTVVVPTFRRPELLIKCLNALMEQDFDRNRYEIVVVDDGVQEETRRLVERCAAAMTYSGCLPAAGETAGSRTYTLDAAGSHPRLRYLEGGRSGPAAARNLGWKAARGDIIAFTDDDCVPQSGWLAKGTASMGKGIAGAGGRVLVPIPDSPTDYELDASGLERSRFVTANCFYRRSALESVGGFDENFRLAWREDSDLYFRLIKGGFGLVETPEAVVVHPTRTVRWGVSIRQQKKSQFNALLYKKHPDLYRQLQPSPPWHYYGIVLALPMFATGLFTWNLPLAAIGFGLWLGLTLRFILRRLQNTRRTLAHVLEMALTSLAIPPLSIYWRLRGALRYRVFFL